MFAVKVEEGREGRDGQPSVGPIYRNPLAKDEFPPTNPDLSTAWELLRSYSANFYFYCQIILPAKTLDFYSLGLYIYIYIST